MEQLKMKYFGGVIIVFAMICMSAKGLNESLPDVRWTCDRHGLLVNITFEKPFSGVVSSQWFYADPDCSTPNMPAATSKEVTLRLPLLKCGNRLKKKNNVSVVRNRLMFQHHPMIPSVSDYLINVTCKFTEELPSEIWDARRQKIQLQPFFSSIEMKLGDDIFGYKKAKLLGVSNKLFIVLFVEDWANKHHSFTVRKCIAHNDRVTDNHTTLVQISEANSCSPDRTNQFEVIGNSTMSEMLAIMEVRPFRIKVKTNLYITCGIDLCKRICRRICPGKERNRWTYVNTYTVENRRVQKRSVSEPEPNTPNIVRSLKTRNNLLRSTVKVLTDRLLKLKLLQKTSTEDINFEKRSLSDSQSSQSSESDDNFLVNSTEVEILEQQFMSELEERNFTNLDWRSYSDFNVTLADIYNTDDSNSTRSLNCSRTVCELEETTSGNSSTSLPDKVIAVDNTLITDEAVLSSNENSTNGTTLGDKTRKYFNINKRLADCVPQIKFLAVTISLGILSGCFFLICIGFYLALRKERKKNSLDSYLLYSFF